MPLINTSLPNLVQGVSQQPATLRFDGQCEEQTNALSSVSDGLKKRPNTRYLTNLLSSEIADGAFVHFINRDKNEKYVLIINSNVAQVFNMIDYDTVTTTGSTTYSSGDYLYVPSSTKPKDVLKALTVGDTTFILNTSVNVDRTATKSDAITASSTTNKALVFIKKGDYSTEYNIKIKAKYYTSGTLNNGTTFTSAIQDNEITYTVSGSLNDATSVSSGTLSSSNHEFNASFKTNAQASGATTQGISTGLIAKSLRDSIYRALRSFAQKTSGGGAQYLISVLIMDLMLVNLP